VSEVFARLGAKDGSAAVLQAAESAGLTADPLALARVDDGTWLG
jgi:hypothetical protein